MSADRHALLLGGTGRTGGGVWRLWKGTMPVIVNADTGGVRC